jgi:hypothetical protein
MKNRGEWIRCAGVLVALAVLLGLSSSVGAQTVSGTFKVVCLADPAAAEIRNRKACLSKTPRLSFGDTLTLAVEHAPEVSFDDADEPNPADLVLFLSGKPLPGTHPSVGRSQLDGDGVTTTLLSFRITRDLTSQSARKNWKEVIVAARAHERLTVSAGLENGPAAQSRAEVDFVVIRGWRLLGWGVAFVAGLVIFFSIAARTGALRDKEPAGTDIAKPYDRAFSLSRTQMALWTILALFAYLYIWFLTGEYNATIPASVVGLMGITLTTYGAAAALDKNKAQTQANTTVCKSEDFFSDITTSAEGASLHRLQFIFWTLALAVVFVVTVWNTLAMPDFDATLLGLMGLTSGTYVGLKVPEKKT